MTCLTNQLKINFFLMVWSFQLRSSWDAFRIHWSDEALFLQFVTTESVYYSLLGSESKLHTLLFFHVFISALEFVFNKLCSLLCPFLFYLIFCSTGFIYSVVLATALKTFHFSLHGVSTCMYLL